MNKKIDKSIISGLPIHATNDENTVTICGIEVDKTISFHRGRIMLGIIKGGEKIACNDCLLLMKQIK